MFATLLLLFADDPAPQQPGPLGGMGFMVPMLIILGFFLIMTMRRSSLQNRERAALLASTERTTRC